MIKDLISLAYSVASVVIINHRFEQRAPIKFNNLPLTKGNFICQVNMNRKRRDINRTTMVIQQRSNLHVCCNFHPRLLDEEEIWRIP